MNASNLLQVGFAGCVCLITVLSSEAASAHCVAKLRMTAPKGTLSEFRVRLEQGRLARVPDANCRNAEVRLTPLGTGYRLTFSNGPTLMTREVKSTELAAVWVESWLVPAESLDATPLDTSSPPPAAPTAASPRPEPSAGRHAVALSVNLPLTFAIGSLWLGPELRYHQGVGPGFWLSPRLGIAYAITHQPEDTARMVRATTCLEYDAYRSPRFLLSPGIDVGMSSLLYRDRETGIHLAGPSLGAQLTAALALSNSWWLLGRVESTALLADRVETTRDRVYFSSHSDNSDPVDLVTTEERLKPTFIGALTLGLSYHWGVAP